MDSFKRLLPGQRAPDWHVVLGSGFGKALDGLSWKLEAEIPFKEVPGLPTSRAPDHAGQFRLYSMPNGKTVRSEEHTSELQSQR